MELTYKREGAYLIPELEAHETSAELGRFGQQHREYLRNHHPATFTTLMVQGDLPAVCQNVEDAANRRIETIMTRMKQEQGVTEDLKSRDPMAWTSQMNNIKQAATEIVTRELVLNLA